MDGTVRAGAGRCGQVLTGAGRCGQVRARSKNGVACRTPPLSHIYHMRRKRTYGDINSLEGTEEGKRRRKNALGTNRGNTPRTHARRHFTPSVAVRSFSPHMVYM